ncbi:MAG: hypothetical protein JNN07_27525 [Verrucomicrobiales bacterium]|nr:hypothetical protein [Verrucomicrobiales bacterium]
MSLLDALLLDPPRLNVWVALRNYSISLGILGSGTQTDPYTVVTASDFDSLMRDTTRIPNTTCVHLGPAPANAPFLTAGYYDGLTGSGWQARPGMRIVGSGIDVTVLKLVNTTASKNIYAVAHDSTTGATVDFFEISELTIHANFSGAGTSASSFGAVRIMGSHSRIVRVKAIDWGNKWTGGRVGYVFAMLSGNGTLTPANPVVNCGIQECIAVNPASSASWTNHMAVFHVGNTELPGGTPAYCAAPYIRNNFVDAGQNPLTDGAPANYFRGLSMAWCKAGVVEGNLVQNIYYGGPYNAYPAQDVTIRFNTYRNVAVGPIYNFGTAGSMRLLIEGNQIELTKVNVTPITGVGSVFGYGVILYNASTGSMPYGSVVVRNNWIKNFDEGSLGLNPAGGTFLYGASNLLVRENVLDVSAAVTQQMMNRDCTNVQYFENRNPAGVLIQGVRATGAVTYDKVYTELATDADDALILSLLRHRA